jgi:DNA invertase Pin-like site-specific DNA recombinase
MRAYARTATKSQDGSGNSIANQLLSSRAYAGGKNWEIAGEYVDDGKSGSNDQRPGFQRMLDDALAEPCSVNAIVVKDFSRLFRNSFLLEMYRRKLRARNIRIVSVSDDDDDDETVSSTMIQNIMALMDEWQARERAETRRRRRAQRERGSN